MDAPSLEPNCHARAIRQIAGIGVLALAVAMGIGRFAFTPLMPLMLRDGSIDAATGAEWAAANYGGYLLGAAGRFAWPTRSVSLRQWRRRPRREKMRF